MTGNLKDTREEAFLYLQRLLPQVAVHEVAGALESTSKVGLAATIAEAGRKLGAQFYRVEAPLEEILDNSSTLPALELGDCPRVILSSEHEQVQVLEGSRKLMIPASTWGTEPCVFLVPSPRMTLAALRNHPRVKRVLKYLATERPLLKAILVYAVVVEALNLTAPIAVQVLINTIGFGMINQQLIVLSVLLLIALAGATGLRLLQMVMVEHLSRRFFSRTLMDFSERLPLIRSSPMKNKVHRFFEVAAVDKAFFVLGLDLIAVCLQLLAATVLLALYHPVLLSFTALMVVSAWFVVRLPFSSALNRSLAESHAKYELADFLEDGNHDDMARLAYWGKWLEARQAGFRITIGQQAGLDAIQVVLGVALLFVGGHLVIDGQLTLGQLVAAELVAGTALMSLSKLGKQLTKVYDLITSFEKLGAVIDLPIDDIPSGLSPPPRVDPNSPVLILNPERT